MTAGIGKLFGYTGGFLYGFLFLAFFCGLGSQLKNHAVGVLVGVVGLLICHVLGAFHYSVIAATGFGPAFLLVSVPYLVKDVLSVIGALVVALVIKKTLSKSGIHSQHKDCCIALIFVSFLLSWKRGSSD